MIVLVTILHVIVALFLIVVVLLQTGKRADLAGAFGGGGSQTAFGTRGAATVLSRATAWSAGIFMVTSLILTLLQSGAGVGSKSVLDSVPAPAAKTAPVAPAPKAPAPTTPTPPGK